MKKRAPWTAFFISILLFGLTQTSAHAGGIYKCVGEDGVTSYSQTACGDSQQLLIASRTIDSPSDVNSCRIAERFALSVAGEMRSGTPSGAVFRQYGGIDSIGGTAVALVNYVFTFQNNYRATSERIASLTGTRCLAGSFGPVTCRSFPQAFLGEVGGCELSAPRQNNRVVSQADED